MRHIKKTLQHFVLYINFFPSMASKLINIHWISEPVLSHAEKKSIVSYYVHVSTNIKIYNHNIKTSFVNQCLQHHGAKITYIEASFNLIIIHFYIHRKLL